MNRGFLTSFHSVYPRFQASGVRFQANPRPMKDDRGQISDDSRQRFDVGTIRFRIENGIAMLGHFY
jgi:hypothetical protein